MDKTNPSRSKHFRLYPLAEGVYAALAEDGGSAISNSGIIDLGDQLVVFDTFMTPQAAADLRQTVVELFGRAPQLVVNSHYHNDHIWGNQVFAPEAQIISSDRTCQLITTAGAEELKWYSANSARELASLRSQSQETGDEQRRSQLSMWIGYYEGLVEAIPHLKVCLPGLTFNKQLEIHGSRYSAELMEFEGAHTASDSVLYLPGQGIVFMSDLLFVGCHPYLADGDPLQLLKALEELSQLDAACFVPGHGPAGTIADLKILIEYVETCLETARMLVKQGNDSEAGLAEIKMPEKYEPWQYSQFFLSNIRFLCRRLNSAAGDKVIQ